MTELHSTDSMGTKKGKRGRSVQVAPGERKRPLLPITKLGAISAVLQRNFILI